MSFSQRTTTTVDDRTMSSSVSSEESDLFRESGSLRLGPETFNSKTSDCLFLNPTPIRDCRAQREPVFLVTGESRK